MKKAFTLAETLIVLVVIGILAAVLLPVARNIAPDRNLMKFKKAHVALGNAIRELVQSEEYYLNGDLGVKINGDLLDGTNEGDDEYFCNTLAQVLNVKHVYCKVDTNAGVDGHLDLEFGRINGLDSGDIADNECRKRKDIASKITTTDGIDFYIANPKRTFGLSIYNFQDTLPTFLPTDYFDGTESYYKGDGEYTEKSCTDGELNGNCAEENKTRRLFTLDYTGFVETYVTVCIDIDGIKQGEDPFGYGVRYDGKIFTGKRATEWLEKAETN